MKTIAVAKIRRSFFFGLIVSGLIAAIVFLPNQFRSQAGKNDENRNSDSVRTVSRQAGLENYDIRTDKNKIETLANFRQAAGKDAVAIADVRDRFVAGENALRRRVPTLKIEYNDDIRTPETIAPDASQGRAFLTAPSNLKHSEILRRFVKENNDLIGVNSPQADALKVAADYTNPDGNLSYANLEQTINGIPVFRGEVKAGFIKNGAMFRVINNLAPALDNANISNDFGDALDALKVAAGNISYELKDSDLTRNDAASTDLKAIFGAGDWATTAEKMYFPIEPGVARPAWRVLIWEKINAYYVMVDAETKTILWRKNITDDQTQTATFSVYTNPNSMLNVAKNPAPLTFGPIDPTLGTQGAQITRTDVTLIGNEAPNTFNNLGWITDNANGANGWTDGNNVQAGLDIASPDGIDASTVGINRVFNFPFNPPPGMPAPSDLLTTANSRDGAVTQLFYIDNRYHDEMYKLGFTEAARNFQNDNFGRGGVAGDRVSAEAQDNSGTNNANFSTPADGGRGRMQMYAFTQTPGRDGDLDGDVIVHEHTHGLSNRLIGNGSGLTGNRAGSMGEGWSDFYGLALLSQPSDPIDGIYPTGAYVTGDLTIRGANIGATNTYYGIRRFPYAVKASTGGPNNRPHNPLTFADLNTPCDLSDGAFPPSPSFATSACSEVHAAGEIWAVTLWEVRARFVQRLGWAVGNKKILQIVTDGMKLTQNNPNYLQARDAILAAAQASSSTPDADVADVWAGFATRGMGFSATDDGTAIEAFDLPNVVQSPTFTFSDAGGNHNGYADPGETLQLSIPLTNNTGNTAAGTTLQIVGGGTANYGDIANAQTITRSVSFTVPAGQACGSVVILTLNINSSLGPKIETRQLLIGQPFGGINENFDSVTAPAFPNNWTAAAPNPSTGSTTPWQTAATNAASAPNAAFAPDPTNIYTATLESPVYPITVSAAKLKFKIKYDTEPGWDGTTLDIKIGAGAYQDILAAGGTFVSGAYPRFLNTGTFPQAGRQAWTGNSNGYGDVEIILPAAANNQNVQFRWNASADTSVGGNGTQIDDVSVITAFNCSSAAPLSKARADFDGDGKTDLSVFRPLDGNWYVNRSADGFTALAWGASTDLLVPGDYDGDGKTDVAVARRQFPGLTFYVLNSSNSTVTIVQWGATNDVPQIGDYDGDGKADIAVFRYSDGTWYIRKSTGGSSAIQFGSGFDVPVASDYDGDGKTDVAVFRDGTWYINGSLGTLLSYNFGLGTDKLVPADYDGDGKTDVAVYRPSNGTWYIQKSTGGFTGQAFGNSTDIPVPGDYDGDGKSDIAVYRSGTWYANRTTAGFLAAPFGVSSDLPIPKQYIP